MEKQELIDHVKELRVCADGILILIKTLDRGREVSLVITKMQEGRMWLGKILQALGTENPYPKSMDSSNETIEPEADKHNDKEHGTPCFDAKVGEKLTQTNKVKQLRELIEFNIITEDLFTEKTIYEARRIDAFKKDTVLTRAQFTISIMNAYTYFTEAKMWLGVELGRIRETQGK